MSENNNRTITITLPDGYELAEPEKRRAQPGESYLWFNDYNDYVINYDGCEPTLAKYWILRRIPEPPKPGMCRWCGEPVVIRPGIRWGHVIVCVNTSGLCPFREVRSQPYATEVEAIEASNWVRP